MKRSLLMLLVMGLVVGSMTTAEAEQTFERTQRTVDGRYPAVPDPLTGCAADRGTSGCVVVDAHPMEDSFTAKVVDAHGQPVFVQVVGQGVGRATAFCGETTQPVHFLAGSRLEFLIEPTPYFWSHWGTEWLGPLDCPYRVATTGTISVTLSGGWTTSEGPASPSPGPSASPAPQPSPSPGPSESPTPQASPSAQPEVVERSVDLALRRHLRGVGSVVAPDASCRSDVPVVIQRKSSDSWLDIASTTTDADGKFAVSLADRSGRYRAIAPEVTSSDRTCLGTTSVIVRHRH